MNAKPLLLAVTLAALSCARREPVVLPATAPVPPTTAPPRAALDEPERDRAIRQRREAYKLRQIQQQERRMPRPHRGTTAPSPTTAPG